MFRKYFLSAMLVIVLAACNLNLAAPATGPSGGPTTDPQVAIDQAVTQTISAQTQIAQSVAQTLAAMVTETPSVTPSPTFTFTPEVPRVTVSVETNCRTGPGTAYDVQGVLPVGQSAEIIGRNASGDTWIIRLPSNPSITCWLWGYYGTVTGNTSGLTIYTPPPTPTPAASFAVSYVNTIVCGPLYAFRIHVTNDGSVTWESIRMTITDNTTATTFTHTLDSFRSYGGCLIEGNQQELMPGEAGMVTNVNPGQLNYNPAGHSITAVIRICSVNGLAGTCLEKTISFTP